MDTTRFPHSGRIGNPFEKVTEEAADGGGRYPPPGAEGHRSSPAPSAVGANRRCYHSTFSLTV